MTNVKCVKTNLLYVLFVLLAGPSCVYAKEVSTQVTMNPLEVAYANGEVVDSLTAEHRHGQTFITWAELPGEVSYHVYRHTEVITKANLDSAELLTKRWGPLDSDTSINKHATDAIPTTYVIEDLTPPLSPRHGLFVHTGVSTETAYYAVTTVVGGTESKVLLQGKNTLINGVSETIAKPEPVLALSVNSGSGRVYTQYMDYKNWNPTFNGYAYNYIVTLPKDYRPTQSYPLLVSPHAYGDFLRVKEESEYEWQVIQLFPSDPMDQPRVVNSWWYGYAADHNYHTDGEVPSQGRVANFTEQRVMMAIEHTIDSPEFNVDPSLVHAFGHSMGASGSLSLGLRYGNILAGIYASEPMTNYATDPVFQAELKKLWGSQESNLPVINRGPYSEIIQQYNGIGVWDWMNHQAQLQKRRGDKMAYLMVAHGKLDDVIDWETQGAPMARALNDAKVGFAASFVAEAGHTWLPFASVVQPLFGLGYGANFPWRYPLNLSFPSIQNASASGGITPSQRGDDTYNLDIEWATPHTDFDKTIVDLPGQYEVSLRSMTEAQTADITPRNTQLFSVVAGVQCRWQTRNNNKRRVIAEGVVTADSDALLTVKAVNIQPSKGTRLIIDCR